MPVSQGAPSNQWRDTNFSQQWTVEHYLQFRSLKRARDIYEQIERMLERTEIPLTNSGGDSVKIRKALAAGFFGNLAHLGKGGSYNVSKSKTTASIHPSSCLKDALPRTIIYHELVLTSKEFLRNVFEVQTRWLTEVCPHVFQAKDDDDEDNNNNNNNGV